MEKTNIHWLGSLKDFWTRNRPRIFDRALGDAVNIARKSILLRGVSVVSKRFTTLIDNGWNPVPVGLLKYLVSPFSINNVAFRMCSPSKFPISTSTP